MIKFFSKIRYNLMEQKITGKYLKYAIGEIVLVVFGILIALQLNNWNGDRIQNAAFENLIEALEKELIFNIDESNYELHWGTVYMQRYADIINENVSTDMYKADKEYFSMIMTNKLDVIYDDIEGMINKQDQFPDKYKVLIPHLKKFNNLFSRYKASEADLENIVLEYVKFITLNEPWVGNKDLEIIDSEANLQRLEFIRTNPTFKNFLKEHNDRYTEALRNMSGIRSTCIVLIAQIKKIRGQYSNAELQQEIAKHGIEPFESYGCEINDTQIKPLLSLETIYPFFNASDTTSFIVWTDDRPHKIELQPGEITTNSFTDRIQAGTIITLEDKDCRVKFKTDVHGYLLIGNESFQKLNH